MKLSAAFLMAGTLIAGAVSTPLLARDEANPFVAAPGNAIPSAMRGQWGVRPEECAKQTREIYLVGQHTLKYMTADRNLRGYTDGTTTTRKVMIKRGNSRVAVAQFSGNAGDERINVRNMLTLSADGNSLTLQEVGENDEPLVLTRCR